MCFYLLQVIQTHPQVPPEWKTDITHERSFATFYSAHVEKGSYKMNAEGRVRECHGAIVIIPSFSLSSSESPHPPNMPPLILPPSLSPPSLPPSLPTFPPSLPSLPPYLPSLPSLPPSLQGLLITLPGTSAATNRHHLASFSRDLSTLCVTSFSCGGGAVKFMCSHSNPHHFHNYTLHRF